MPGPAIQPQPAILHPGALLQLPEGAKNSIQTNPVRTVRIGQIAGGIYLVGFHFFHQFHDDAHVVFTDGLFAGASGFVKRHVQKVNVVVGQAAEACPGASFSSAYKPLDLAHLVYVVFFGLFLRQRVHHLLVNGRERIIGNTCGRRILLHKLHETHGVVVMHGDVAGGLVSHMHIVALLY